MLQSYLRNTRPLLGIISRVSIETLDIYGITIHGIKSSSRGIFAEKIGNDAESLEKAAYSGNFDFVSAHNQDFLDGINKLLEDIEKVISNSGMEQKPKKENPDPELLVKLLDACDRFDIDDIDKVMAEIEHYDYVSDDGLVYWLRENIDQGIYKSVKEKLKALTKDMEV